MMKAKIHTIGLKKFQTVFCLILYLYTQIVAHSIRDKHDIFSEILDSKNFEDRIEYIEEARI